MSEPLTAEQREAAIAALEAGADLRDEPYATPEESVEITPEQQEQMEAMIDSLVERGQAVRDEDGTVRLVMPEQPAPNRKARREAKYQRRRGRPGRDEFFALTVQQVQAMKERAAAESPETDRPHPLDDPADAAEVS